MIQALNNTMTSIITDPLVAVALPMEMSINEYDKIVMGIKKVSAVVNILYGFYKDPKRTPLLHKIVTEIRTVMDSGIFIGEVKKNLIV